MAVSVLVTVLLIICDSGRTLSLSNHTDCFSGSDVVFLIDGSASLTDEDFNNEKDFVRSMVSRLRLGPNETRVGLVQFSSEISSSVFLDQGHSSSVLDQALDQMRPMRSLTNTGRALKFVATNVFSKSSRAKVLILITDGDPSDRLERDRPLEALRNLGVQTFVVGFGHVNPSKISLIASTPHHSFFVSSSESLHLLPMKLCSPDCFSGSDVVFLIDGSASLTDEDFNNEKDFVRSMVSRLRLGPNETRVGLVQFSSETSPSVFLDQGHSSSVLDQALDQMRPMRSLTNTGRALAFVATDVFSNSSRSKVLVLTTDGDPTDSLERHQSLTRLRELGVQTFVVGFGHVNPTKISLIASTPHHTFFFDSSDSLHLLPKKLCSAVLHGTQTAVALV